MNYYNPYYWSQYPYNNGFQNQSYSNIKSMEWVSGEVGAKAFAQPAGWPPDTPIALWDSTEKKIFLKSWNQMGAPNPMQELDYEIKERTNPALLPENISGEAHDMSKYVTKEDLEELKREIKNLSRRNNNQGGERT
jgi:hypothetical protein